MHQEDLDNAFRTSKAVFFGGWRGKWEREGCNDATLDRAKNSLPNLDVTIRHHQQGQVLPRSVSPPDLSTRLCFSCLFQDACLHSLPAVSVPPLCYVKPCESVKGSQEFI